MSGPLPPWEKSGNVSWVSCPACRQWFPVGADLLAQTAVALACPHCGKTFRAPDAAGKLEP